MSKIVSAAALVAIMAFAAGCAREPEPVVAQPPMVEPEPSYEKF